MRSINVGLIGYGFMGKVHSNAYRQVKAFFDGRVEPRMKILCGRTAEAVKKAAGRYGWEESCTDWREVISRNDVDLIDISTPGDSHHPIALAAAEAGKVVLCEKPLANTLPQAEEMFRAVTRAGVLHMICHNYRKVPAVVLARRLIADGRLGRIYHFRGTYLQDWLVAPEYPRVWRLDKDQAGSGTLGDILSHSLDLARYLVGEINEVSGSLETFIRQRPLPDRPHERAPVTVDDAAAALVRFANGATGTLEASRLASGRKAYNRFEINGSRGSIVFNLERLNELEVFFNDDPAGTQGFRTILVSENEHPFFQAWWPPGHIIGWEHTFTHLIWELMEAIADDRLPRPNFEDGLRNQRVLDAIERSARDGVWRRIPS